MAASDICEHLEGGRSDAPPAALTPEMARPQDHFGHFRKSTVDQKGLQKVMRTGFQVDVCQKSTGWLISKRREKSAIFFLSQHRMYRPLSPSPRPPLLLFPPSPTFLLSLERLRCGIGGDTFGAFRALCVALRGLMRLDFQGLLLECIRVGKGGLGATGNINGTPRRGMGPGSSRLSFNVLAFSCKKVGAKGRCPAMEGVAINPGSSPVQRCSDVCVSGQHVRGYSQRSRAHHLAPHDRAGHAG